MRRAGRGGKGLRAATEGVAANAVLDECCQDNLYANHVAVHACVTWRHRLKAALLERCSRCWRMQSSWPDHAVDTQPTCKVPHAFAAPPCDKRNLLPYQSPISSASQNCDPLLPQSRPALRAYVCSSFPHPLPLFVQAPALPGFPEALHSFLAFYA